MKKIIAIISATLAFVACTKEIQDVIPEEVVPQKESTTEGDQIIKLNVTVNRSDELATDTKSAHVKKAWTTGDVIYILFTGTIEQNPQYLIMRRAGDDWEGVGKNGLTESSIPASGQLTAIFLPYGNNAVITANELPGTYPVEYSSYSFTVNGEDYCGYFLIDENVPFTFSQTAGLTCDMELLPPYPADPYSLYMHFDVTDYIPGNSYRMYQEHIRPIRLGQVNANGTVVMEEGLLGRAITGYEDATGFISFSGLLDGDVAGDENTQFRFSICDETLSILYTKDAGKKLVSSAKKIGLGDILDQGPGGTWQSFDYVDFRITNAGERILWSKTNLGTSGPENWGDHYAWADTYTNFGNNYTDFHNTYLDPSGSNYPYMYPFFDYSVEKFTKYVTVASQASEFNPDGYAVLKDADDIASMLRGWPWRIPSVAEWQLLMACDWEANYGKYSDLSSYATIEGGLANTDVLVSATISANGKSMILPASSAFGNAIELGTGAYWTRELSQQLRLTGIDNQIQVKTDRVNELLGELTTLTAAIIQERNEWESAGQEPSTLYRNQLSFMKAYEEEITDRQVEIGALLAEKALIIDDICTLIHSGNTKDDARIQELLSLILARRELIQGIRDALDPDYGSGLRLQQLSFIRAYEKDIADYQAEIDSRMSAMVGLIDDSCTFASACVFSASANPGEVTVSITPAVRCSGLSVRPVFTLPL